MIGEVMDYCNNHFIDEIDSGDFAFVNSTSKITGTFTEDHYVVGSYIYVTGAKVPQNNNAFKIVEVDATYLVVDSSDLVDEDSTDKYTVYIMSCRIPNSFLSLVTDIDTWNTSNSAKANGVASEKIDDYSINFGDAIKNGGGWQGAFGGRLREFKSIFSDLKCFYGY